MITPELHGLGLVITIETTIIGLCCLFILWRAATSSSTSRHRRRQVERANRTFGGYLESGELSAVDQRWLRSLPARKRIDLFSTFAGIFVGEERTRIHDLAQLIGLDGIAKRRCRSRFWSRRLQGARLFAIIGGGETYVLPLFQDRHVGVRTGAAEWAANHPDEDVIEQLVLLLGDNSGFCRFVVKDSFVRLGPLATTALLDNLESNSDPSDDALDVATWISDARFLSTGLRLQTHPSSNKRAHALALLASIGGQDALSAATAAIHDDEPNVRIAALKALARIAHWNVAPLVATALRDPEWDVRLEAAMTLYALGAPGILLLRRALRDNDAFAAGMAQHVLDINRAIAIRAAS